MFKIRLIDSIDINYDPVRCMRFTKRIVLTKLGAMMTISLVAMFPSESMSES